MDTYGADLMDAGWRLFVFLIQSDVQLKAKDRDQLGIEYSALLNCHVSDLQRLMRRPLSCSWLTNIVGMHFWLRSQDSVSTGDLVDPEPFKAPARMV